MSIVTETIEVDVPISVAYNQWTQFEDFPQFMGGIDSVTQIDDTHLHWVASIAGVRREWTAVITEQVPDKRIAWTATEGTTNSGLVTFDPVGPASTRVSLTLEFEPAGVAETVADKVGLVRSETQADLERFRDFITTRGAATGAWRREVHGGFIR
jgi:uncharacterized membrane protein